MLFLVKSLKVFEGGILYLRDIGVEKSVEAELEQKIEYNYLQLQNEVDVDLNRLFSDFDREFSEHIGNVVRHFWQENFSIKLVSIETTPGFLWKGNNYFVSQASMLENADCFMRLSEMACITFFEVCFGKNNNSKFRLDLITELEAEILSKFNNLIFDELQSSFISKHEIKKLVQEEKLPGETLHFSFMLYKHGLKNFESGKIIISIPKNIINIKIKETKPQNEEIELSQFNKAKVKVDIFVGTSKISLNELKNLDCEDIVVLDKSDIYKMTVLGDYNFDFKINPNPKLVNRVKIDTEGGDEEVNGELTEEKNMWDNIQVEIGAEFKRIKLTLGELKQMSEGLVIDIANVYENEIILTVENKPVAKGELIIIGDKYGVRLTQIVQAQKPLEEIQPQEDFEEDEEEKEEKAGIDEKNEDDEDFDLSDFEIEEDDV